MTNLLDRVHVHVAFEMSLAFKGAFALVEIAAGVLTYLVTPQFVLGLVQTITQVELTEDPRDFIASHLLHAAQEVSVSSQHFASFYMLSHGIIKLWLIIGLWRGKLAYYPVAIGVFRLFILYQVYRYTLTQSLLLVFISIVDAIVIGLIWLEYRGLRQMEAAKRR